MLTQENKVRKSLFIEALMLELRSISLLILLVAFKFRYDSALAGNLIELYVAITFGVTLLCLCVPSLWKYVITEYIKQKGIPLTRMWAKMHAAMSPVVTTLLWFSGYYVLGTVLFFCRLFGCLMVSPYVEGTQRDV